MNIRRTVMCLVLAGGATLVLQAAEAAAANSGTLPPVVDWSTPQTKAPLPDGLRYGLLEEVRQKPAVLLSAMARQARDEGRFADAVFILQTALDSPWGREDFQRQLKAALAATNQRMNKEARGPLYEQGYKLPAKGDILVVMLFEPSFDKVMGTTRVRYEVKSLMAQAFEEKWRLLLLKRSQVVLKEELDRRLPGNLLEYRNSHQEFFLEGHFNSEYPQVVAETNLELGLLYKDTQDYVLARHHLEASLAQKAFLSAPDREFQARYALAEIQVVQGKLYDYEKTLKQLCSLDREFTSQEGSIANRRRQMVDVLLSDPAGLDKVIELYRLPDDFSLSAHRQLGSLYLQRKNYDQALLHLIFSVLKPVSHAMTEIQALQYGYAFTTMADFLATARQYPEIREYLQAVGLFDSLYYLSQAALGYKPNYLRLPRQLWTVLASSPEAGPSRTQAVELLRRSAK